MIDKAVYLYTILLFGYALLSWFPGGYQSVVGRIISKLCEPYLSLFDRWNLRLGPVDFTIMAAVIVLNLAGRGLMLILANIFY